MSIKKTSRTNFVNFDEVWIRLLTETSIKNHKQLAGIAGVTGAAVSARAQKKEFPVEWGFVIAQQYGLNTDWLLTGEGKAKKGELAEENKVLQEVIDWVKENSKNNDSFKFWFLYELEQKFPEFAAWRKRKESLDNESTRDLFNPILQKNAK